MELAVVEEEDRVGPGLVYEEFEKVLGELQNKVGGTDAIPTILKALESKGKRELFEICADIYTCT